MTNTAIQVRTGSAHEAPNHKAKATSASLGSVTSSTLVNGTVTFDAYDHNSGRRIYIDFCSPHQTITPASVQAERMRRLAETLLQEAERLERLVEKAKAGTLANWEGSAFRCLA